MKMEEIKSSTQLLAEENQRILNERHKEEFQVLLQIPNEPNLIRLTLQNIKAKVITSVEELDALEVIINASSFKGRGCIGWCSKEHKELRSWLNGIKVSEFKKCDYYLDGHYKKY